MTAFAAQFAIRRWAAWAPGVTTPEAWRAWASGEGHPEADGQPALAFVDAMTRRRLSRLSRMALDVAHQVLAGETGVVSVFASRHGEMRRTAELLSSLARQEALSPTTFSLSVHNTASGLHSIVTGNTAASTAIAAGDDSLRQALAEALGQLAQAPARPVLLVYADEPLPEAYAEFRDHPPFPLALALLLEAGDQVSLRDDAEPPHTPEPQALALLRALVTDTPCALAGPRNAWTWSRH